MTHKTKLSLPTQQVSTEQLHGERLMGFVIGREHTQSRVRLFQFTKVGTFAFQRHVHSNHRPRGSSLDVN
jgi:hypothetical protein